jgi:hypothetical protein
MDAVASSRSSNRHRLRREPAWDWSQTRQATDLCKSNGHGAVPTFFWGGNAATDWRLNSAQQPRSTWVTGAIPIAATNEEPGALQLDEQNVLPARSW